MKFAILVLSMLCTFSVSAQMQPKREPIYHCLYQGMEHTNIEAVYVIRSNFGKNVFYELFVEAVLDGQEVFSYKKVPLLETYGGRIATYGTGNIRVKIDHVFPVEGKFRSFVRIPEYGMHSNEWFCKSMID